MFCCTANKQLTNKTKQTTKLTCTINWGYYSNWQIKRGEDCDNIGLYKTTATAEKKRETKGEDK